MPVEVKAGSLVLLHGTNVHKRWASRQQGRGAAGRLRMRAARVGALPAAALTVSLHSTAQQPASERAAPDPSSQPNPRRPCSKENTSPQSRHAYAVHFVEGADGYTCA